VQREEIDDLKSTRQLLAQTQEIYRHAVRTLADQLADSLGNVLLGEKIPLDVVNTKTGEIIIPANRKITKILLQKLAMAHDHIDIDPSPIRNRIREIISLYEHKFAELKGQHEPELKRLHELWMQKNAKFIIFAVKQSKEAEAFGFTRNDCCHNLKTALHQYRQNQTFGLHGQSQKARIRSKAAMYLPLSECALEHVIPEMVIVNRLMEMEPLTEKSVRDLLTRWLKVVAVTFDEHARLKASGLRSIMPANWDGLDVFARFAAVGIELSV
jgi:hypothetical protein